MLRLRINSITSILMASIAFLIIYSVFIFDSYYYAYIDIGADTVSNYWPQLINIARSLKEKDYSFYSFNIGIGTSLFSNSSLLTDPFNFILFLGDPESIPEKFIFILYCKILLSCFFGYKLLELFDLEKPVLMLGSFAFAYSGWATIWGQHYTFHSIYVFSLILIYSIELKLRDNSKNITFIISVTLLLLSSLYGSFMTFVVAFAYGILRICQLKLPIFKTTINFLIGGVTGFLISSVLVLPSIYELLQSPRISGGGNKNPFSLVPIEMITQTLTRMISPNLLGVGSNSISKFNYYEDPNLYFGTLGLILCLITFSSIKNRKGKCLVGSIAIYLVCFNFFNTLMNGFSGSYFRWHYLFVFILIVATSQTLSKLIKNEILVSKRDKIILLILPLVIIILSKFSLSWNFNKVATAPNFFIPIIFYYCCLTVLLKIENSFWKTLILVFICLSELTYTSKISTTIRSIIPHEMKMANGQPDLNPGFKKPIQFIKNLDSSTFRIHFLDWKSLNEPLHYNYYGIINYSSLNDPNYIKHLLFANDGKLSSYNLISGPGADFDKLNLLGVKYLGSIEEIENKNFELIDKVGEHHIYRLRSKDHPLIKLSNNLIPKSCYQFNGCKKPLNFSSGIYDETLASKDQCSTFCEVALNHTEPKMLSIDKGQISFILDTEAPKFGALPIPFHKGFRLFINKKEVPLFLANGGLIGFKTATGINNYVISYTQPMLEVGLILTLIGIIICILYVKYFKRRVS